jgi:hypothetical protein
VWLLIEKSDFTGVFATVERSNAMEGVNKKIKRAIVI